MITTVEATYENGVLRPAQPLPLAEQQKVQITVETGKSPLLEAYGIMAFKGTAAEAEYFALHPELLPEEEGR